MNKDDELYNSIDKLIGLEHENVKMNYAVLSDMMQRGEQRIDVLDRVADRLLDSMHSFTGAGEDEYKQYLDYINTFNPNIEAYNKHQDQNKRLMHNVFGGGVQDL